VQLDIRMVLPVVDFVVIDCPAVDFVKIGCPAVDFVVIGTGLSEKSLVVTVVLCCMANALLLQLVLLEQAFVFEMLGQCGELVV
jgi:hypothetical protein